MPQGGAAVAVVTSESGVFHPANVSYTGVTCSRVLTSVGKVLRRFPFRS